MRTLIILLIILFTFKGYSQRTECVFKENSFKFVDDFDGFENEKQFLDVTAKRYKELSITNEIYRDFRYFNYYDVYYKNVDRVTSTKATKNKGEYIVSLKPGYITRKTEGADRLRKVFNFKVVVSKNQFGDYIYSFYRIEEGKYSENPTMTMTYTPGYGNKVIVELFLPDMQPLYDKNLKSSSKRNSEE
jgi:hypothetical protein